MTDRVRIGVIGAGIMGQRLLDAARLHAEDVVEIAGVWDPDPAAMARVAGFATPCADADALIEAADCVYIASPPSSHLSHARTALEAGRAVLLEKPLAIDLQEARAFVDEHGTDRVAVNFPMASSPAVARLAQWIAEGAVGRPDRVAIEVAFAAWPRAWQHGAASWLDGRAQGGFVREVVSHFLFLTGRLLGPVALRDGAVTFAPGASERLAVARFRAGGVEGVPGTLHGEVGATEADDKNRWTLDGPAGSVRLRDWSVAERRAPGVAADTAWDTDPDALPNPQMRPLVLRRQLEGVVRLTLGEPHALATLAEALAVQEVVEALLQREA